MARLSHGCPVEVACQKQVLFHRHGRPGTRPPMVRDSHHDSAYRWRNSNSSISKCWHALLGFKPADMNRVAPLLPVFWVAPAWLMGGYVGVRDLAERQSRLAGDGFPASACALVGEGNGHSGETCASQLICLLRPGTFPAWTTNPAARPFSFRVGGGGTTPVLLQWQTLGSTCLRPPKN